MHAHRFAPAVAAVALVATAGPARASAVFNTDRNAFIAAHPHLTVEGFESANIGSGQHLGFAGPLSVNTDNGYFRMGDLQTGFAVEALGTGQIYLSRDFGGNSGANVSSNVLTENMNVWFTSGITAVGIDLLQWAGNDGGWTVEAYDIADNLLGRYITLASGFMGLTSSVPIARLFLDKPDVGGVIDNLRFGVAGGGHTVPEPSSLLLVAGAALALRVAAVRHRRRR